MEVECDLGSALLLFLRFLATKLLSLVVLLALNAGLAGEVEVIVVGILVADADALGVLPDVTLLARNAESAIIDLTIRATDAVKHPILIILQLLKGLLFSLNLSLQVTLGQTASLASLQLLVVLGKVGQLFLMQDALRLTLLETLLTSLHTRLSLLFQLPPLLLLLLRHLKLLLAFALSFASLFLLLLMLHFACDSA